MVHTLTSAPKIISQYLALVLNISVLETIRLYPVLSKEKRMIEVCASCEQPYGSTYTCKENEKPYKIEGKDYRPIPFTNFNKNARCPHCGVKVGGYHHYGCDEEICPKCSGHITECDCPYDTTDEETD